jgi:glc operon protein GlcG
MESGSSLGHDEAQLAIAAMRDALLASRRTAVLAVADAHGELLGLLRLDGAPIGSVVVASNKAWTAARERKPTRAVGDAVRDPKTGFDIAYFGDPRYTGWGGGLPVTRDGHVVGAVAVSGLTEDDDADIARLGVEVIAALWNKKV